MKCNGRVKIYQSMDGWIRGRMHTLVFRYQLATGIGHRHRQYARLWHVASDIPFHQRNPVVACTGRFESRGHPFSPLAVIQSFDPASVALSQRTMKPRVNFQLVGHRPMPKVVCPLNNRSTCFLLLVHSHAMEYHGVMGRVTSHVQGSIPCFWKDGSTRGVDCQFTRDDVVIPSLCCVSTSSSRPFPPCLPPLPQGHTLQVPSDGPLVPMAELRFGVVIGWANGQRVATTGGKGEDQFLTGAGTRSIGDRDQGLGSVSKGGSHGN